MKIFIVGITGLLGSEAARILFSRGHEVSGLALPQLPEGLNLPKEINLKFGNYLEISDEELHTLLKGYDAFIFAAGVDERVKTKPSALETFNRYNVYPLAKMLKIAKQEGIKNIVVLGSYFTYFNETKPKLKLAVNHPYIQSRLVQKELLFSFSDSDTNIALLELPYIFGVQKGRKPVWVFLIEMILKMGKKTYYPTGGSAMVTVRQVGEAIAGAVERNKGTNAYPIGYYNIEWNEMLKIMHNAIGEPKRKIISLPHFIYRPVMAHIYNKDRKAGYEGGLNLGKFARMHCSKQYVPNTYAIKLGVTPDDINQAIYDSARLSYEVIKEKRRVVEMEIKEK